MALDLTSMLCIHFPHSSVVFPSEGQYIKHLALIYLMTSGSSFSLPRPLTLDFNLVLSSNELHNKSCKISPAFALSEQWNQHFLWEKIPCTNNSDFLINLNKKSYVDYRWTITTLELLISANGVFVAAASCATVHVQNCDKILCTSNKNYAYLSLVPGVAVVRTGNNMDAIYNYIINAQNKQN